MWNRTIARETGIDIDPPEGALVQGAEGTEAAPRGGGTNGHAEGLADDGRAASASADGSSASSRQSSARVVVPFETLPFINDEARQAAITVLRAVLRDGNCVVESAAAEGGVRGVGNVRGEGGLKLILDLWTKRGQMKISTTALLLASGSEPKSERLAVLCGQVLPAAGHQYHGELADWADQSDISSITGSYASE